jgi:hypothetical protein
MNGKTARLLSKITIASLLFSGIDRAHALDTNFLPPYGKISTSPCPLQRTAIAEDAGTVLSVTFGSQTVFLREIVNNPQL